MSTNSLPITPSAFREALPALPLAQLYAKAAELRNSVFHLQSSNIQLRPFAFPADPSEHADQDCIDAIHENEQVITRVEERLEMLREEVERRGGRWVDPGAADLGREGDSEMRGDVTMVNGDSEVVDGLDGNVAQNRLERTQGNTTERVTSGHRSSSGRLSDEELRRQLIERLGDPNNEDDDGMHL